MPVPERLALGNKVQAPPGRTVLLQEIGEAVDPSFSDSRECGKENGGPLGASLARRSDTKFPHWRECEQIARALH